MIRVVRRHSPAATIFIAGFSGLHGSRRKAALSAQVDSWIVERHIFRELDQALGLQCLERTGQQHQWTRNTKRTGDIGMPWYNLTSRKGFRVLDRMNVWGDRRIDGLHPIFAAQRATFVQLLLNGICPRHARSSPRDLPHKCSYRVLRIRSE